jgi:hypothetical protein
MTNRREFIQRSTLFTGGIVTSAMTCNAFGLLDWKMASSDQLNIGVIGIKISQHPYSSNFWNLLIQ